MLALYLLGIPIACGFAIRIVSTTESKFVEKHLGLSFLLMITAWPLIATWLSFVTMILLGVYLAKFAENHLFVQEQPEAMQEHTVAFVGKPGIGKIDHMGE